MTTPDPKLAARLAEAFHSAYERLAPSFGYETREDTKTFSPDSQNGKLMIATCTDILSSNQLITTAEVDARVKVAVLAGNAMVKQLDTMMLMLSGETAMTKSSLERALSGALDARNMWTDAMSRKD